MLFNSILIYIIILKNFYLYFFLSVVSSSSYANMSEFKTIKSVYLFKQFMQVFETYENVKQF